MKDFNTLKQGFTDVKSQIGEALYKAEAPIGSLFGNYKNTDDKSFLIIKAPKDIIGIEGFQFDVLEEEQITMNSIITEHAVEDRNFVADHISNQPITVSIKGIVGEIFVRRDVINQAIDITTRALDTLSLYNVPFTKSASQKIFALQSKTNQAVSFVKKAYADGKSLTDLFFDKNQTEDLNRIQNALQFFNFLRQRRIPCNLVLRTAGLLKNMCITKISAIQEGYENVVSFSLEFHQISFVSTQYTEFDKSKSQLAKQNDANPINKGAGSSKQKTAKSVLKEVGVDRAIKKLF